MPRVMLLQILCEVNQLTGWEDNYGSCLLKLRTYDKLLKGMRFVSDIYGPVFGQSEKVDQLFTKLRNKIGAEIDFQQKGFELLGSLDTLFATTMASTAPSSG